MWKVSNLCVKLGSLPLETIKSLPLMEGGGRRRAVDGNPATSQLEPSISLPNEHSAAARGRTSLARFPSLPRNSSQKRYQVVAPPLPAFLEIFTIWDKQSDFSFILKSVGEKTLLCIYRTFTTLEPGDSIAPPSPLELPAWAPQRPEDPLLRGPQLDVSPGRGSGPFPGSSLGFLSLKALVRNR